MVSDKRTIANLTRDNLAFRGVVALQQLEIDKLHKAWAADAWKHVELQVQLDGIKEALSWKAPT